MSRPKGAPNASHIEEGLRVTIIMSPRTKRALERSAARNRRAISYEGAVIIERALGLDESGEIGAATVRGSRIHGESMECVPAEKGA